MSGEPFEVVVVPPVVPDADLETIACAKPADSGHRFDGVEGFRRCACGEDRFPWTNRAEPDAAMRWTLEEAGAAISAARANSGALAALGAEERTADAPTPERCYGAHRALWGLPPDAPEPVEAPKRTPAEDARRREIALAVEAERARGAGEQKASRIVAKLLKGKAGGESNIRKIYRELANEPAPRLPKLPREAEAPRGKANGRTRLRAELGLRGPPKKDR